MHETAASKMSEALIALPVPRGAGNNQIMKQQSIAAMSGGAFSVEISRMSQRGNQKQLNRLIKASNPETIVGGARPL